MVQDDKRSSRSRIGNPDSSVGANKLSGKTRKVHFSDPPVTKDADGGRSARTQDDKRSSSSRVKDPDSSVGVRRS